MTLGPLPPRLRSNPPAVTAFTDGRPSYGAQWRSPRAGHLERLGRDRALSLVDHAEAGYEHGLVGAVTSLLARARHAAEGADHRLDATRAAAIAEFVDDFSPTRDGLWTLRRDERILGAAALDGRGPGLPKLRWFAVDGAVRGLGHGRTLLESALARAAEHGAPGVQVHVHEDEREALGLYHSAGFEVVGVVDPGARRARTLHMALRAGTAAAPAAP